jgi:Tol biopolymer transport system component
VRRAEWVLVAAATLLLASCDRGDRIDRGDASTTGAAVPSELAHERLIFTRGNGTFVARADGSDLRRVLNLEGVFEFQADASPDGTRLVLRVDEEGPQQGTWLVAMDGSQAEHVAGPAGVVGGAADWAPDGRGFVLTGKSARERFFGLYVFSADGIQRRRITPDEWEAQYPAWSPDGRTIAFTRVTRPNGFDIWLINADGRDLRQLTGPAGSDNYAAWSPDGSEIVYSSEDRPTENGLWIMSFDGSRQRYLTQGGEPQWEPGEWIVYDCPVSDPGQPGRACAVRPDGSGQVTLPLGREAAFPNGLP